MHKSTMFKRDALARVFWQIQLAPPGAFFLAQYPLADTIQIGEQHPPFSEGLPYWKLIAMSAGLFHAIPFFPGRKNPTKKKQKKEPKKQKPKRFSWQKRQIHGAPRLQPARSPSLAPRSRRRGSRAPRGFRGPLNSQQSVRVRWVGKI